MEDAAKSWGFMKGTYLFRSFVTICYNLVSISWEVMGRKTALDTHSVVILWDIQLLGHQLVKGITLQRPQAGSSEVSSSLRGQGLPCHPLLPAQISSSTEHLCQQASSCVCAMLHEVWATRVCAIGHPGDHTGDKVAECVSCHHTTWVRVLSLLLTVIQV